MEKLYISPEMVILEMSQEGVVCASGSTEPVYEVGGEW